MALGASTTGRQAGPAPRPSRRPRVDLVTVLCLAVVVAAVVVRIVFATNQSYWIDEIFSVDQTSAGYRHLLDVGWTEVHTPLYTTLLWAWQLVGGPATAWTRLLSVLTG
ncbi:MAG TPA: hypothetical protein VEV65_07180, partial [Kineosporiaceae bacterium]|nr:hypothetical protein [Kineosporiaceae bacterium]